MSFSKDALWSEGHDESVEVNQRALIDKVLARYSGEFSVFRELLQNSDDASSSAVEIRFETEGFLKSKARNDDHESTTSGAPPDLKTAIVHQWTFRNNGLVFRDEDWNRLKKIAEGNPDEEKIGAFGVGFYSLFSVTEEPFVTSGDQWMGFYWKDKKDQLFARRGTLPPTGRVDQWTSFAMTLRDPSAIPPPFDFTRFLASSIVFMSHLSEVSVYFDNHCLVKISKSPGAPRTLAIPRPLQTRSTFNSMEVKSVAEAPLHISASIMKLVYTSGTEKPPVPTALKPIQKTTGFFSSLLQSFAASAPPTPQPPPVALPTDPSTELQLVDTSISLSIFSADVDVRLPKKVGDELLRATKKKPPSKVKYQLIYTGKDGFDASKKQDEQQEFSTGSIFQGLRADIEGTGSTRIFVGHSTAQTTGIGGHMASRFIPTVERESLDLMDKNVALWNKELLYVGGFLSRCVYEFEMDNVRTLWNEAGTSVDPSLRIWLRNRAIHALNFFTFRQSTPSPEVSSLLEAAFFGCSAKHQFPLISSVGVRPVSEIRLPEAKLSTFLKSLPMVPDEVMNDAKLMVTSLRNRGMLLSITSEDVIKELHSRPLDTEEMIACLQWWIDMNKFGGDPNLPAFRSRLLSEAILAIGDSGPPSIAGKIIPLSTIQSFVNTKGAIGAHIPVDGPLPPGVLPAYISSKFRPEELSSHFPWKELTVVEWLQHICEPRMRATSVETDIGVNPKWAETVLQVLLRAWPSISNESKTEVARLLSNLTCIPTSQGQKKPGDTYFSDANILGDLPVVTFPSQAPIKGALGRFLQFLGVRKYVDLQIVFTRMIKTGDWKVEDLIKYLVAVEAELKEEDWGRLKLTPIFSKEGDSATNAKPKRYRADQLYEPSDTFRQLHLPVIAWTSKSRWRASAAEAKLLFKIGLLRFPPLAQLIDLCSSDDTAVHTAALKYLLDNIPTRYSDYNPHDFAQKVYIPANNGALTCLSAPLDVFSERQWASLGFLVATEAVQTFVQKLKIPRHPSTKQLIDLLRTSPPNVSQAKDWFSVLSTRISDFSDSELTILSNTSFIPIPDPSGKGITHTPPRRCLLNINTGKLQSKLFTCVDFGAAANSFLSACGTKREASVEELAQMLLADPRKFYDLSGGPEHFLNELRNIAVNNRLLSSMTFTKMKKAPILLGVRRRVKEANEKHQDLDEETWDFQYDLLVPSSIVIVDDSNNYQLFGDAVFTAPQEDILEAFYAELGSRPLSSIVKQNYRTTQEIKDPHRSSEMHNLILERLPLFLHGQTHARLKVPSAWLSKEGNFAVKNYGKIEVESVLTFGDIRVTRRQESSAAAKRDGYGGAIQLWVAYNTKVDMFEVATSLGQLLFDGAKANDMLLFMTILSTDLKSLKRRGYNVDRILRQQQHAKDAALESQKKVQEERALQVGIQQEKVQQAIAAPPVHTGPAPVQTNKPLPEPSSSPGGFPESPPARGSRSSIFFKSIQDLRNKVAPRPVTPEREPLLANDQHAPPQVPTGSRPGMPGPARSSNGNHVTPLSNIDSNINMAIKACRPENGNLVRNKQEMQQVKESLNDGYCDISGQVGDLNLIGEMGSMKIFVTAVVLETKRDEIARFIHVVSPLAKVYNLPMSSLHIFYDLGGGLIAFNRNASIFLNLRYFEAWHHDQVQRGNMDDAFVSWYFTLAHEIAHNLVQPHNSEHEFYFSAICEKHIKSLGRLLSSAAS
ncbi:hypothetical protein PLEOSDRAFT_50988 [Pleurotus ostreatus PC15]|uniref:Sacsin/Nov domain-containing protein n=1 Tax=Pleurotus ostreatus (strain PC15) TaxID=1137138 RepID=A0A067NJ78_PLEO1|nr:hypothetical protein PLEOSDRAFT_50988 [Pleurotus ostreatus PC15]